MNKQSTPGAAMSLEEEQQFERPQAWWFKLKHPTEDRTKSTLIKLRGYPLAAQMDFITDNLGIILEMKFSHFLDTHE